MPKKPDDSAAFEIGSPLERREPIAKPGPPRRRPDTDHDKTPVVETMPVMPVKHGARTQALLDEANAEIAHVRKGLEDAVGTLHTMVVEMQHEDPERADDQDDDSPCSAGPDECFRCLAIQARAAGRRVLENSR